MRIEEIKRAVELLKAEKEGRLIEMPCNVNDKVQFYWGKRLTTGTVTAVDPFAKTVDIWSSICGKVTIGFDTFSRSIEIIKAEEEAS